MRVELVRGHVRDRAQAEMTRVVDDHVEAAGTLEHGVDDPTRRFGVGEIVRDDDGGSGAGVDLCRDFLEGLAPAADQGHRQPATAEQAGRRGADAGAGTRDDGGAVGQSGPTI